MKGIELARAFYLEYGAEMIRQNFAQYEGIIAVGLCGSGSECFGYDDDISADHDFEPGFCMFIPGEQVIDSRTAFKMERAYAKLPKEFMGYKRSPLDPVGGNRHGVIRTEEFFIERVGRPDGALTLREWLAIPENFLFEATDGEVFRDDSGAFTSIRQRLKKMPADVKHKKLAGGLLLMAKAGQYNYPRMAKRGDGAAAQLCAFEFARGAMQASFALAGRYRPYYKWAFRAMREFDGELADNLEKIISMPNDGAEDKYNLIEYVASVMAERVIQAGLSQATCADLEKHAYSVNDRVADPALRNESVLYTV